MNIREFTKATGVAERQVRYLIAEGFMPPPRGGRARAEYGPEHVESVRRFQALKRLGFPPSAIKLLLQAKQGAPFPVAPGVWLVVDPALIGSGQPAAPLIERAGAVLEDLLRCTEPRGAASPAPTGEAQ